MRLFVGVWLSPYAELMEGIFGRRSGRFVTARLAVVGLLMDVTSGIAQLFANKYNDLYSSVAYDKCDMDNVLVDIDAMLGREDTSAVDWLLRRMMCCMRSIA